LAIETAEEGSIETAILASSKTKHMNVLKNLNQNRDPLRLVMACLLFLPATITMNAQSVTDQEAFQRGTQAVIWGVPAVSMMGLRRGSERDLGATFNDIIYMSHPMVSRHGFLTANNQVPYVLTNLNSTDGPVVSGGSVGF
jgi:hypothetical protein